MVIYLFIFACFRWEKNVFNDSMNKIDLNYCLVFYRKNIKILSALFNDRPMTAMDTAIYWVEYVARHGNILKSPATNLTWWQYYLIDVYATVLFGLLFILFIVKFILKFLFKIICSRKSNEAKMSISKIKKK